MWHELRARIRALRHWRRQESDLDDELRFHLAEEAEERAAAGLPTDEARFAALKDFGNVTRIREDTREVWGWGWAERLIQDVRYALRTMRRQPGFSAIAIVTLALGIGGTTAIFTVMYAAMLRPLPFPEPNRIVAVFASITKDNDRRDSTSFLDFSDWQRQSQSFTGMAAYRSDRLNVTGGGAPEPIVGLRGTHELLGVLGVRPILGRGFDEQEQHGKVPVALISHGLWARRYGSDPQIVGKSILLNEVSHAIVGVLPPGFQFPPFARTDVLLPIPERPSRSSGYLFGVGRLKAGVHATAAQAELKAIARGLEQQYPKSNEGRSVRAVDLQYQTTAPLRTSLVVLFGASLFVLLIGCANVANLVLARGITRQRELAVRSALGAGQARLVRQLLTESVSLAIIAALLGSVLALWISAFFAGSLAQRFPLPEIGFNWTFLGFALSIAVLSGLISGLPLTLMVWKASLSDSLKQGGRTQAGGLKQRRLGSLLVVGETALTLVLLIGAGLLVKSFIVLQQIDLGVNTRPVLTADLVLSQRRADPERRDLYVQALIDSIRAVPGVQEAAIHTDPPFMGGGTRETFNVEGRADPRPDQGHVAGFDVVSGSFFDAIGIPVTRGRGFDRQDSATSPLVAVVNETMARQFWPNGEAIGKRLHLFYDKDPQRWWTIVGVARDVRYRGPLIDPIPQVFVPSQQRPYQNLPYAQSPFLSPVVRTSGDPASLTAAVQAAIWTVDKDQPIANMQPLDRVLWDSAAAPRLYMLLLGAFAAIALAIACAGIYGLSAYAVVRRTQEMGIRMALGATSRQILSLAVRQGVLLILAGTAIGIAGSLALRKVMSGFLIGITATDTPTFLAVLALFGAVALLSTYIPARRAARIDPLVAFRYE